MKVPPIWRSRIRSPLWMSNPLNDEMPSYGNHDFEVEMKIPEHVHKYIDFQFMCDWFDRINRYAEFEFQSLLDKRSKEKK